MRGGSAMTPATVATPGTPYSIAVDPTGRYAFVTNNTAQSVSQYTIGGAVS